LRFASWLRWDETCVLVLAARCARGLRPPPSRERVFSLFPKEEGDGAPKGASCLSCTHSLLSAWRLSARRPALSRQPGHASGGYRPPRAAGPLGPFGHRETLLPRQDRRLRTVSRLPAGGPSAPGWSPGTARARVPARTRPRTPSRPPRSGATGSWPLMRGGQECRYTIIG
jgi:hypothetical protein